MVMAPASGAEWHAGTVHSRSNQVVHSAELAPARPRSRAGSGRCICSWPSSSGRRSVTGGSRPAIGCRRRAIWRRSCRCRGRWRRRRTTSCMPKAGSRAGPAPGRSWRTSYRCSLPTTPRARGRSRRRGATADAAAGHPVHRRRARSRLATGVAGGVGAVYHRAGTTMRPDCPRCGRRWPTHVGRVRGIACGPGERADHQRDRARPAAAARRTGSPGDRIAIEDPGYLNAVVAARDHRLEIVDIPRRRGRPAGLRARPTTSPRST